MAAQSSDQDSQDINNESRPKTRQTKYIHLPKSYKGHQSDFAELNTDLGCSDNTEKSTSSSGSELMAVEGIASAIPVLIQAKRDTELKLLLNDVKNESELKHCCWEVVPSLCTLLHADQNPIVLHLCDITLAKLVEIGNPKEILLELLSHADAFIDDVKLNALLTPIQQCILRLPSKRGHSLALTLETLYAHVEQVELPDRGDVDKLEGKEIMLMHSTEEVMRLVDMCEVMMNFVQPFVDDLKVKISDEETRIKLDKEIIEIIIFLLKIMSKPLVHLDLNVYKRDNVKDEGVTAGMQSNSSSVFYSDLRMAGERAVKIIGVLYPDYISLFKRIRLRNHKINRQRIKAKKKHHNDLRDLEIEDLSDVMVEEEIPEMGLACLAFLAYGEGVAMDDHPQVYVPRHHLEINLTHAHMLLSSSEICVQHKGTLLIIGLLQKLDANTLSAVCLDDGSLLPVVDLIVELVISSQSKTLQQSTLSIIPTLLRVFIFKARLRLLSYLMNTYTHPGFIGYVVGLLKDQIHFCLQSGEMELNGKNLQPLLRKVFTLPQQVETDLLEEGDNILGVLNLLRYLIVRDPEHMNVTGIWQLMEMVQSQYLDVLRQSLNMSRAHYQLDLDKMLADPKAGLNISDTLSFNVGSEVSHMPNRDEKLALLRSALNRFDLIESLLGRVNDLISLHKS